MAIEKINRIEVKSILSKLRSPDPWFGISYNMNLYRGCQHGCIYCDTRSDCYGIGDISAITIKSNALDLLAKELKTKRIKSTIGTGSMNDPYMPVERAERLTRGALEIIADKHFPVHIITKSDLVVRDADIITEISKTYAAVSFTITTADDKMSKLIEPGAPLSSRRFEAIKALSEKGIYTGITMMPILPFISDQIDNIETIARKAKEAGASYIVPAFGVTMRGGSREYFYRELEKKFPNIKEMYESQFRENYICNSPESKKLAIAFKEICRSLGLRTTIDHYTPPADGQLTMF